MAEPTDEQLAEFAKHARKVAKAFKEFVAANDRARRPAYTYLKQSIEDAKEFVDAIDDEE